MPPDIETAILRICQEALTNIRKHALATEIKIALLYKEREITLMVQDNGIGFDTSIVKEGSFGFINMQERARLLGGRLSITSEQGEGTSI